MTNIPDSGWLSAIHKVPWWTSAAIALTAAIVFILALVEVRWFGQMPTTVAVVIGASGILALCLLIFRGIDLAKEYQRNRVSRRFDKLSQRQQDFLLEKFKRGSRRFEMPVGSTSIRWFEELGNWNYVEYQSSLMFIAGQPMTYYVTEDGWKQLEKHQHKIR